MDQRAYESEGLIGGAGVEAAKAPMSSTEAVMSELEMEIMSLDEQISELFRKIKPVIIERNETVASEPLDDRAGRSAESALASSIQEKARRLRDIKLRVRSVSRAIDL